MASDEDEFFRHSREEMFPKMKGSAISITLAHDDPDPKLCMELGAAILFDKPIICVVLPGRKVANNLRRVASAIVEGSMDDPKTKQRLQDAISNVLANDVRTKQ